MTATESLAKLTALSAVRVGPCDVPFCEAKPGMPCTSDGEPAGDHFRRYVDAAAAGRIKYGALQEIVTIANHIVSYPIIPAELAGDITL